MSTGFARDYHMNGEIAATSDGKIVGLKVDVLADHGAFNATAQPTKYPAGFFHIFTGEGAEAGECLVAVFQGDQQVGLVAVTGLFVFGVASSRGQLLMMPPSTLMTWPVM